MLYDLTTVSGARVSQVDEMKVAGRFWIRSSDFFLILGGAGAGLALAGLCQRVSDSYVPYLLVPALAFLSWFAFTRKRSIYGEKNLRRFDRWYNHMTGLDGAFVLPGADGVFDPNRADIVIQWRLPLTEGTAAKLKYDELEPDKER